MRDSVHPRRDNITVINVWESSKKLRKDSFLACVSQLSRSPKLYTASSGKNANAKQAWERDCDRDGCTLLAARGIAARTAHSQSRSHVTHTVTLARQAHSHARTLTCFAFFPMNFRGKERVLAVYPNFRSCLIKHGSTC